MALLVLQGGGEVSPSQALVTLWRWIREKPKMKEKRVVTPPDFAGVEDSEAAGSHEKKQQVSLPQRQPLPIGQPTPWTV
jgi:hypothetical protein